MPSGSGVEYPPLRSPHPLLSLHPPAVDRPGQGGGEGLLDPPAPPFMAFAGPPSPPQPAVAGWSSSATQRPLEFLTSPATLKGIPAAAQRSRSAFQVLCSAAHLSRSAVAFVPVRPLNLSFFFLDLALVGTGLFHPTLAM